MTTKTAFFQRAPIVALSVLYFAIGAFYVLEAIPQIASQVRPEASLGAITAGCGVILIISAVKIFRNGLYTGAMQLPGVALSTRIAVTTTTGEITTLGLVAMLLAVVLFSLSAFLYAVEEVGE